MIMKLANFAWCNVALMTLAACGGGGGGGSSAPSPVVTNTAPTITDPGALSLLEGSSSVVSLSASDAQNNSLSFSIASGDDEDLFSITTGGVLSFNSEPDFETRADANADNVYEVTVQVSDGSLTDTQDLTITVTDAFEGRVVDAPIAGATVFVDLNGNNEQDADEPSGVTDDSGFFNVDAFTVPEGNSAKVISKGGTDTKTGKALPDLALISDVPADITKPANVTPLTTVVASVDTPEEKAQVLQAMGIDKTPEELLTTDNWAAAEEGDETAKAAQRVNQQVGLLLQTAATVADDGDESTDISVSLAKQVATEISEIAVTDEGIDLTSADTLTTVLSEAVAEVAPEVVVEDTAIAAVASSVATVNTVVADPTLDPLSDVAADIVESAQEDLQTSVADVVSGEVSVEAFEEATDTTELFADVVIAVDALDTDEDGLPDALDTDDDGDGVADGADAFSKDATETLDTDGDGIGNNADTDDDGDSVLDTADAFPLVGLGELTDTDGDGRPNDCDATCQSTGMIADTDDDGDGVADDSDAFPLDSTETLDTDADGIGNNADTDDDADGVLDTADAFPLDKTETLDTDADGIGNNADTDDDGDSVLDAADAFPLDKTETLDTDADGIGNNTDTDDDGDGVSDTRDSAPLDNTITPPTAVISANRLTGRAPQLIEFEAKDSIAGNQSNSIAEFIWDFGDGVSQSAQAPRYIFKNPGTYIVSLQVINDDGLTHTVEETIEITAFSDPISISGKITSPAYLFLDSDVNEAKSDPVANDTFATAQNFGNPSVITGYVNLAGEGPDYDGEGKSKAAGDKYDVYKLNAYGGESVTLLIADESGADLDLYLYDSVEELRDFSVQEAGNATESVTLPEESGTYYIVVAAFSAGSNYNLIADTTTAFSSTASSRSEIVIGDVVVAHEPNAIRSNRVATLQAGAGIVGSNSRSVELIRLGDGILGAYSRPFLGAGVFSQNTAGQAASIVERKLATFLLAKDLAGEKSIKFAEPNYIQRSKATTPNDPFYRTQWHYSQISLPDAWDITTGSQNTIVAVLDTGVMHSHPDLSAKISSDSYDFISRSAVSGDGDGRDADASDPGDGRDNAACADATSAASSFHGTHVAGTVAASSNNGVGVSGVDWSARIMDLRVLGCSGSGDAFDIAEAILYAAGLENVSGLLPSEPADIINLSLGGPSPSLFQLLAVEAAVNAGVIVVAAAGNEALEGNPVGYPAAFSNVISVGATDSAGQIAEYSTHNNMVDVAAPGGDTNLDVNADGIPDGVVSTWSKISEGGDAAADYAPMPGTSMAAPHISGVVALMKSVHPGLTTAELEQLLSEESITSDLGSEGKDEYFGSGLINAYRAVVAAQSLASGVAIPENPKLALSQNLMLFGKFFSHGSVILTNASGGELNVTDFSTDDGAITITAPDSPDGLGVYDVSLSRESLAEGIYSSSVTFQTDSSSTPTKTLTVSYEVGVENDSQGGVGVVWINVWDVDAEDGQWFYIEGDEREYSYVINDLDPGTYTVIAGTDPDNDGIIGDISEVLAGYPGYDELDILVANGNFTDIDLDLELQLPVDQLSNLKGATAKPDMVKRPEACNKRSRKAMAQLPINQKCAERMVGKAVRN
jgi:serine protease